MGDLRAAGMTVEDVDPETGRQFRFTALGGHHGGSQDGRILGVPQAPKTWHLLELKTINEKGFNDLRKNGVAKAQPKHWAQMQTYMRATGLRRALYVSVCKNDDRIHAERVYYDQEAAEQLFATARRVVFSPVPLSKISDKKDFFACQFCEHRPHCQMEQPQTIETNCRTCKFSQPKEDGRWWCTKHEDHLSLNWQKMGCDHHEAIRELRESAP